ncbi:WXG100 family type VII secretion target [Micromonospora sp. NPDC049366]|uniref:WXG100 family type VII secretion target n=1 Tax=Micromonospora sp. NPDC049366 TaxID=3364271 RepID=UPI0037AAB543
MPPREMSLTEFRVVMGVFGEAIRTVETQKGRAEAALVDIRAAFIASESHWQSPAADTYSSLMQEYDRDATALNELLADILRRLRRTYQNYRDVEARAVANLGGNANHGPQQR